MCVWKCAQGLGEAVFPERQHTQLCLPPSMSVFTWQLGWGSGPWLTHFWGEQGLVNVAQSSSQVEVDVKKSEARLDLFFFLPEEFFVFQV